MEQTSILLILNSLWCIGFYTITSEGMLFEKVQKYSVKWFGEYWSKPVCTCPPCMASLHSLWYWVFNPLTFHTFVLYIFYAVVLAGLNRLIVSKFDI